MTVRLSSFLYLYVDDVLMIFQQEQELPSFLPLFQPSPLLAQPGSSAELIQQQNADFESSSAADRQKVICDNV